VPEWPHLKLSPNEMYETGVTRAALHAVGRPPGIDGALAARWLAAFTARVENPLSLLV
jgi:hypothetical protein